jgi:uncharacterized glyoxalase superfamily protein PhnB
MPVQRSAVIPGHRYRNAPAAIEWLCRVFGFERHVVYEGENGTVHHAELTLGDGMIMLGSGKDDEFGRGFKPPQELGGVETRGVYLMVPDSEAVYTRAVAAGAVITCHIHDTPYGSREFTAKDPEGHSWTVGTYDPWAARS